MKKATDFVRKENEHSGSLFLKILHRTLLSWIRWKHVFKHRVIFPPIFAEIPVERYEFGKAYYKKYKSFYNPLFSIIKTEIANQVCDAKSKHQPDGIYHGFCCLYSRWIPTHYFSPCFYYPKMDLNIIRCYTICQI